MRTVEQSLSLIDQIIGRCVREADFGERVLQDPEQALAEYQLNEDELGDFLALKAKHSEEARAHWAGLRKMHAR